MVLTIDFYYQKILKRNEVCDIHSYDMLATEMNSKFISLQLMP